MPEITTYKVQAPDGSILHIDGPVGATDEQLIAVAQSHYQPKPDPTGTFAENLKAGAGKAVTDVVRGAGQFLRDALKPSGAALIEAKGKKAPELVADTLGLPTKADVDESRRLDAPLMNTAGGKVGNVVGGAAVAAPSVLIPVANTVTGAGFIGGVLGAVQPVGTGESREQNMAIGTGVGSATQLAAGKISDVLGKRAATQAAEISAEKTGNAGRDAVLETARQAGYVVPPASVKPTLMNEALESVGGKIATAHAASTKNQKVTDSLARQYLGMAEDSILSKGSIADAKNIAAEPYRQISKVSQGAAEALDAWKQANFDAKMQWNYFRKSGNPEAYKAAQAAGDAAEQALNAIEAEAGRVVNGPGAQQLVEALKAARVKLAKLNTVESALTNGGHVDAAMISKMAGRVPFSDELKLISDFASNFPKAVRTPEKIGGMSNALRPSIGAGVGTVIGGPVGGVVGAATGVAVPWTMRQLLLSGGGQALTAVPKYGTGVSRIADLLADPTTQALLPAAAAGASLR